MRSAAGFSTLTEKFVLLGAASTGKTSIVNRFAHDRFSPTNESTIGAAFVTKNLMVESTEVKLEIWDTGGSEKYRSLAPMYYRDTCAAIIVFDLTSEQSLEDAQMWFQELKECGPENVIIGCAANKSDLTESRVITPERVQEFCTNNNIKVMKETSALDGTNVMELFYEITQILVETSTTHTQPKDRPDVVDILTSEKQSQPKESGCC